jgi:hypothetical protein
MVFLRELLEFLAHLQVLSTEMNVLLFKLGALEVGESRPLAATATHDVVLGERHGESLILYLLFVKEHLLVEFQALLSDLSDLLLQGLQLPVMLRLERKGLMLLVLMQKVLVQSFWEVTFDITDSALTEFGLIKHIALVVRDDLYN